MKWQPKHPALQALLQAISQTTQPVYVVGGVVRDTLLGQATDKADIDLVIEQAAIPTARRVADRLGWAFYPLDEVRDVARLVFTASGGEPLICDIAQMRGGSIEADLLARDFTVNALAFQLQSGGEVRLIDFCRGQQDLEKRLIRRVTAASFAEDPVRLLRAVRFVHQLGFAFEEETLIQIKRMSATVRLATAERLRDELWKLLATATPAEALADLRILGLLPHILPEVSLLAGVEQPPPHTQDVYQHTLQVVNHAAQLRDWVKGEALPPGAAPAWEARLAHLRPRLRQHFAQAMAVGHSRADWLVWHALIHDWGKPGTRTVETDATGSRQIHFLNHEALSAELAEERLTQLRFSRQEIGLAQAVAAGHMRPHHLHASFGDQPISRRACFRFFRDVGGRQFSHLAGVDTVLVALADQMATGQSLPFDWPEYLAHMEQLLTYAFAQDGLQQMQRQPLLDGHVLMQQLQLSPGRQVGDLLEQLLEAQAAGEVQSVEDALALARTWLAQRE
jgi:tRNA nucleotidyltransferase/poly(A) polymerase